MKKKRRLKITEAFLEIARDTQHHDRDLPAWRGSPETMLAHVERRLRVQGVTIRVKAASDRRFARLSTTGPWRVHVRHDWEDQSAVYKAEVLAHEFVHSLQWMFFGPVVFALRYLVARFRWAVETCAYCETVRAKVGLGESREAIESYIEDRPDTMIRVYLLGRIEDEVREHTVPILRAAMEAAFAQREAAQRLRGGR